MFTGWEFKDEVFQKCNYRKMKLFQGIYNIHVNSGQTHLRTVHLKPI